MIYVLRITILAFVIIIAGCGNQTYEAASENMLPTIEIGSKFKVDDNAFNDSPIRRGDIIVLTPPHNPKLFIVMRIIGLPGEEIEIKDKVVYINSIKLNEEYTSDIENYNERIKELKNYPLKKIEEGRYFVMGDNRARSHDSRFFGPIKKEKIIGKVLL